MRAILTCFFTALCLTSAAYAQTAMPVAPVTTTTTTTTVQPATPVTPTPTTADPMSQLSKAFGGKNGQQNLSQVLVVGTLMGCVQKQAGKEAAQAFYTKMQTVGKSVEALCKSNQAVQARDLTLSTIDANAQDPVAKAAVGCYDAQAANLQSMAGPKLGGDLAHYARWARNPATAHAEMKTDDICHGKTGQ